MQPSCDFVRVRSLSLWRDSVKENLYSDLARGPLQDLVQRSSIEKSCAEIFYRRSCQEINFTETLCRDLARGPFLISCVEISYRDRDKGSSIEISCKDLECRSLTEILHRDIVQRSRQEDSYRELVQGSCIEISYSDLAKRSLLETLCRDLLYRGIAKRPLPQTWPRSLRDLLEGLTRSYRDLYKGNEQNLAWHLFLMPFAIFYTDLDKGNLQNLPLYIFLVFFVTLFGVCCPDNLS